MARKKDKSEETEIKEVRAPLSPISPLLANAVFVNAHQEFLMFDFSFIAPSFSEPYDIEVSQVARICLPWSSAELLLEDLNGEISKRKEEVKKEKTRLSKKSDAK